MESNHKPLLLDAIAKNLDFPMTLERVQDFDPDVVVMESSTPSVHKDAQFAEEVKKISDATTVFAGRHVTATTEETLKMFKSIDIVARGEYDYTIMDLANELSNGANLKEVLGISFRDNGNIVNNAPDLAIADIGINLNSEHSFENSFLANKIVAIICNNDAHKAVSNYDWN